MKVFLALAADELANNIVLLLYLIARPKAHRKGRSRP
jgi:hypothetical protein